MHIVWSRPRPEREGLVLVSSWDVALRVWRTPVYTQALLPAQPSLNRLHGQQGQGYALKNTVIVHGSELKG